LQHLPLLLTLYRGSSVIFAALPSVITHVQGFLCYLCNTSSVTSPVQRFLCYLCSTSFCYYLCTGVPLLSLQHFPLLLALYRGSSVIFAALPSVITHVQGFFCYLCNTFSVTNPVQRFLCYLCSTSFCYYPCTGVPLLFLQHLPLLLTLYRGSSVIFAALPSITSHVQGFLYYLCNTSSVTNPVQRFLCYLCSTSFCYYPCTGVPLLSLQHLLCY
jgi:hypothetical protein